MPFFVHKTNFFHPQLQELPFIKLFLSKSPCFLSLGRYGDELNPWGDIIAIAKAWCVTKPGGTLAVGVPTNPHQDYVVYNAHRIYGPTLYPQLTTNWNFVWSSVGTKDTFKYENTYYDYQPVYVFKKME